MSHNLNQWIASPSSYHGMQQRVPQMLGRQPQHSTFNPNANTFIPRQSNYHPMPQQAMQQNNLQQYGHNPYEYQTSAYSNAGMYGGSAPQQQYYEYSNARNSQMTAYYGGDDNSLYDQYGFTHQQQYVASSDLREQFSKSVNNTEIQEILVGLEQLLPGGEDFNSWALAIKGRLISTKMSPEGKKLAVQTACEMAINVTSPSHPYGTQNDYQAQYTMARLLAFLANEVPGLMSAAILPSLEHTHKNQPKLAEGNFQHKANLLMFFADLYSRLESELQVQEVAGKKLPPLAEAVVTQMNDFLQTPNVSEEGMKLLLQVLKLSGRDLDTIPAVYDQMNTLLAKLGGYAKGHPKLSETIKAQIEDLLEQRKKGWGPTNNKCVPSVYCPDGTLLELNDDESRFLEECLEAGGSSSRDMTTDPSDISLDEADVMNEFDSFMKEEALMERTMSMLDDLSTGDSPAHSQTPVAEEDPAATTPKKEDATEETKSS